MKTWNFWWISLWLATAGWARPRPSTLTTQPSIDLDAYNFSTMDKWFYYVGWALIIWAFFKHCERNKSFSIIVLFLACVAGGYLTATFPMGLVILPCIYLFWPRKKKETQASPKELGYADQDL